MARQPRDEDRGSAEIAAKDALSNVAPSFCFSPLLLVTPSQYSQSVKSMSQPCPVKLGAFYQCYGSAPATDGMTTTEVNIALDGFAAGERLMRSRMHNVLDQRRREQIAAILLDKRFISRDLVSPMQDPYLTIESRTDTIT